ncbi:collagen-like protein [Marivirga arenosa]|uniref:Collagen-like protein n=1 Tax=Marivirga arenosa TaxID=3059076 RepID=A0AA49GEL6_9BACT|nr:collagen-like protein [Marivirga sp. ABR2-2]WKK86593.2 collagen-like protein [Marivirga sp. ABR2-2]
MKNLFYIIFALGFLFLGSCTFNGQDGAPGPQGPAGPRGPAGQDGQDGQEAFVFEYELITFSASNEYSVFLDFPGDFVMLDSDVAHVYFLYGQTEEGDNIWRALPQTEFTKFGTLIYNYDFTIFDVNLFLDANFNLNELGASYTDDWIARVVVVPGQFTNGRVADSVDFTNYHEVIEYYGLSEEDVKTVK